MGSCLVTKCLLDRFENQLEGKLWKESWGSGIQMFLFSPKQECQRLLSGSYEACLTQDPFACRAPKVIRQLVTRAYLVSLNKNPCFLATIMHMQIHFLNAVINMNTMGFFWLKHVFSLFSSGSSGIPVKLVTNLFNLDLPQDWQLYQYHVTYSPDIESRRLRIALLYSHTELSNKAKAFDGVILFLSQKLDEKVWYF